MSSPPPSQPAGTPPAQSVDPSARAPSCPFAAPAAEPAADPPGWSGEYEAVLRAVVETAVDGIITIDEQGHIRSINPAVERLFGYPSGEVVGRNIRILMPEPYHSEHDGYLENYRRTGVRKVIGIGREVMGRRKDGSTFPLELAVSQTMVGGTRIFAGVVRDISDRRRVQQALQESQERLTGIIASATDAIITVDESQTITLFNAAAERMFRCSAADALGRPLDQFIPQRYHHAHREHIERFGRTGTSARTMGAQRTLMARRSDGSEFPVEATISQVVAAGQKLYTAIVRDISQRQETEESLKRQAQDLARSNADLENFAHIAAHDLKEPLRGIRLNLGMLAEDAASRLVREDLARIGKVEDLVRRMYELLEATLWYSRVGNQPLRLQRSDAGVLAAEAIEQLRPKLAERNAQAVVLPPMPTIHCDPTLVRQALSNLITNAVKYNESPSPRVEIGSVAENGQHILYVRDNGVGISAEHHESVFGMFKRLHGQERFGPGTGAGLAIVKRIVERHGGRVWMESTPGSGSTIFLTLRAASPQPWEMSPPG